MVVFNRIGEPAFPMIQNTNQSQFLMNGDESDE
jgi:hypothetical protein